MPPGPPKHEQKRPANILLPVGPPRQAEPFCQIHSTRLAPPQQPAAAPPNRSLSAADGAITPQAIAEPKTHSPSFASRNFRAFMTDLLKGMDDGISCLSRNCCVRPLSLQQVLRSNR